MTERTLPKLQARLQIVARDGTPTTNFHRFLNVEFAKAIEGALSELASQVAAIQAAQEAAEAAQGTADDAADLAAGLAGPQYLVAAMNAVLTNERLLGGGLGVTVDFSAPGAATVTVNVPTALGYTPTSVVGLTGVVAAAAFKAGLAIAAADLTNGVTGAGAVVLASGGTLTLPKTTGYTVAGLPAGTAGARAHVTDATAPTFLGALVGGGAVVTPVFHDGAAWVAG